MKVRMIWFAVEGIDRLGPSVGDVSPWVTFCRFGGGRFQVGGTLGVTGLAGDVDSVSEASGVGCAALAVGDAG